MSQIPDAETPERTVALLLNKLVLAAIAKGYQQDRHDIPREDRITDADIERHEKAILATVASQAHTRCSATGYCVEHHQKPKKLKPKKLAAALNARVRFKDQDPDEQFYPARCSDGTHHWHEDADAEGDTCNCGDWYRFADRIEKTPR